MEMRISADGWMVGVEVCSDTWLRVWVWSPDGAWCATGELTNTDYGVRLTNVADHGAWTFTRRGVSVLVRELFPREVLVPLWDEATRGRLRRFESAGTSYQGAADQVRRQLRAEALDSHELRSQARADAL